MRNRKGQTLVAMLVVMAIIAVLAVALFKGSSMFGNSSATPARKDGKGTTVLGQARYAAKDTVCRSDLAQVRAAIQIASTNGDDKPPESLQETRLPAEFYKCPVGGEAYVYDPATGQVHCPHPGHEKY